VSSIWAKVRDGDEILTGKTVSGLQVRGDPPPNSFGCA
jgi:hypothetical protein